MKKFAYVLLFSFISVVSVQAQYFAGGSFNLSTTGGNIETGNTTTDKQSTASFEIKPEVGYFLSEDLAVGLGVGFSSSRTKTPGDPEVIERTTGFSIEPFTRYHIGISDKLSLFGQGQLGFSTSINKEEAGSTTTDGPRSNTIRIAVFPGVSFDLNEKVALEAFIGGFDMAYSHKTQTTDAGDTEVKNRTSNFDMGINMDHLFTTGALNIGMIVKL
jgi:hypothetical protein